MGPLFRTRILGSSPPPAAIEVRMPASDDRPLLLAAAGHIRWRPDIRPAAIALFLRQRLDRGEFRGPLTHEHWLAAAQFILSDKAAELDRDLAELVRSGAPSPPAPHF